MICRLQVEQESFHPWRTQFPHVLPQIKSCLWRVCFLSALLERRKICICRISTILHMELILWTEVREKGITVTHPLHAITHLNTRSDLSLFSFFLLPQPPPSHHDLSLLSLLSFSSSDLCYLSIMIPSPHNTELVYTMNPQPGSYIWLLPYTNLNRSLDDISSSWST